MEKVIFIDRDGVINVDLIGDYIKRWDEFRFEKGAEEGLKLLCDAGFSIIIISNQAGIGDGVFSEAGLEEVQSNMLAALEKSGVRVTDTFYCLHGKKEGCGCRKPETGLFEKAAAKYSFDASETFFIGDKATDIEAGKRFGLKTFFVRTGHGRNEEHLLAGDLEPDCKADNLLGAAQQLTKTGKAAD